MNKITIRGLIALVSLGLSLLAGGSSAAAAGLLNNNAQVPVGSVFMFGGRRFIKLGLGTDTGGATTAYTMMAFPFDSNSMDESASSWNTTNSQSTEPRYGSNNWIRGGGNGTASPGSDIMNRLNSLNYGVKSQYQATLSLRERNMIANFNWNMYAENGTTCKMLNTSGAQFNANCLWAGKVALPSHAEWGTGTANTNNVPIKETYCQAVFGGACPAGTASIAPRHLWLRTPQASSATLFWYVHVDGSLVANLAYGDHLGVAPALYLTSTTTTCSGSGTMNDPYYIAERSGDCANLTIPTSPDSSKIESKPIGTVVEFGNRKWIKMDDIHEPLQRGRYFMAATREANNVAYNDGSKVGEVAFKNSTLDQYLQNTVLPQIGSTGSTDWLETVSWDVDSNRDQHRVTYDSKISVVSYSDWYQRWWSWCGTAFGRTTQTCLAGDFGTSGGMYLPWMRNWFSWNANDARSGIYPWHIGTYGYGGVDTGHTTDVASSVIPVVVFKDNLRIQTEADMAGRGTLAKPYHLCDGVTVACNAAENVPPELAVASATWHEDTGILSLSGTVGFAGVGKTIEVWADVCNTTGECVRRQMPLTSTGSPTQAFPALVWTRNDLPAGNYAGTIWVGARVADQAAGSWRSAESAPVSFSIAPRTIDLTVVRGRAFDVTLGDVSVFGITPGTNSGVTVSREVGTNIVSVSGTVTADTAVTFGSVILNIKTIDVPASQVINVSLN